MTDIIDRLSAAIHLESAAIAPYTSPLIETAKEAILEIDQLRRLCAIADASFAASEAVHSPPVADDKADAVSELPMRCDIEQKRRDT